MATNYLDDLAKLRTDYGQRIAGYPQQAEQIRSTIYGGDKVLPTLRSTRDDAIMSLWDVDKRLAERYANPSSETFIRDPYKREQLAAGQHQSVLGSVTGADRMVQQREDLLGNLLDKSLELLKFQIDAKTREHAMLIDELNASLRQKEAGGGADLLDLLGLQGLTPGKTGAGVVDTSPPTGQELFKARVLSNTVTDPKTGRKYYKEPATQQQPAKISAAAGGNALTNFIDKLTSALGTSKIQPVSNVTYPLPKTDPKILTDLIAKRPPAPVVSSLDGLGLGGDIMGSLGANPELLKYISQTSPKFANQIAEKAITEFLFPKEGKEVETPEKRKAIQEILDDIAAYGETQDRTPEQLYKDLVATYPEMTAEEILVLLKQFVDISL